MTKAGKVPDDEYNLPDGLTPAARRARERFMKQYQTKLNNLRSIALNILVWGPSIHSDTLVARKRLDIYQALQSAGHNPMFSEDLGHATPNVPLKMMEFAQASSADLIVVLVEDSPGALAEAHDFCNHPALASNMIIMYPKRSFEGYSARGAIRLADEGYGSVYWYDDSDIPACHVLTRALNCAEARRIVRAFRLGGR